MRVKEINFVKEQYNSELEQRDKLINRISINVGLLSFLFTGVIFYIGRISVPEKGINLLFITIGFVLLLLVIAIIVSCYLLFKSFTGYEYKILPSLKELKNEENKVADHYEEYYDSYYRIQHNEEPIERLISSEMDERLLAFYWRGCEDNRELNLKRAKYIGYLTRGVFMAFFLAMLLVILPMLPVLFELVKYLINFLLDFLIKLL